jgi:hypothetical protein
MELSVFRVRIAPLLDPDALRALRCVSRAWQEAVDQLVAVKGALGLRKRRQHNCKWTPADVRFAHAYVEEVDKATALKACAGGELQDLQWALATFPLGEEYKEVVIDMPELSIKQTMRLRKGLTVVELSERVVRQECMALLIQEHGLSARDAFLRSCCNGHLEMAQWLTATFGLTAEDARSKDNEALRSACADSEEDLEMAQWLTATFGLTAEDARSKDNEALRSTCPYGRLEVAKWLVATFGLTAEDARSKDNEALRHACLYGQLEAAKWLVATFGLTADDARSCDNDALRCACQRQHVEVAQWLTSTFGLTLKDGGGDGDSLLRTACEDGDLEMAQWLATFILTAVDVRRNDNLALRSACLNGHLALAQWLMATFGLTAQDARSGFNESLRSACDNGHLDVVQWLVNTVGLKADARFINRKALLDRQPAVGQWLMATFEPQKQG